LSENKQKPKLMCKEKKECIWCLKGIWLTMRYGVCIFNCNKNFLI